VNSCTDGQGVIDYLENGKRVDVILADYKMVNVSGIDVARYIKEKNLPVKMVLLTGYAEFQIAQKAIHYGVQYYLLKPTDLDEMTEAFLELKAQLDSKYMIYQKEELFTSGLKDAQEGQLYEVVMPSENVELEVLKSNIMTVLLHIRQYYAENMSMTIDELRDDRLYEKVLKTLDKDELLEYYNQILTDFILKRDQSGGFIVKLLSDIAEVMYLNPTYISRVFSQSTGETFTNYLTRLKMEYAGELLKNPELKIYEIGARVGYQDLKNFYRQFKKVTGLTPTEYRNKKC
jgi:two-component system response regulator YesN